jgi:EmrB/QacA subfamily drug resistance transporter
LLVTTSNRWLILIAMTGSLSMIMIDQTVVTVALPDMSRDLPLSANGQQWVVNAYVLALAALVAVGGKLGNRLGPVTCFRLGVIGFFAASVGCALAPHDDIGQSWMLVARGVQGAGAALMMPVSAVLVTNAFPVSQRGRAMAIYAGISQIFLATGPLIGGVLTEHVSWRAVFWLNLPVGLATLVLVHIARPPNDRHAGRMRPLDVVLLVAGLASTVFALQQASQWGWGSGRTIGLLALGVALTSVFVWSQLRTSDPLVAVRLLGRRAFAGDLGVAFGIQFALLGAVLYSSLYLQDLLKFSPVSSGLAVLPFILPITVAAQLGGRWYDRAGVRPPVLIGLGLSALGFVAWTISLPHLTYIGQIPGMILAGLGLGLTLSPNNTDALGRADDSERTQASALLQTFRQLGGTVGVAVIGTIVLSYERAGTRAASPQHAADAITAGFAAASIAFAATAVFGWFMLSRTRIASAAGGEAAALI